MRNSTSPFAARVYALVARIPKGSVSSYGQIALMLGYPRGARAVGWALHWHPNPDAIPWHRVVNRDGYISTSCEEHTKLEQKALLTAEDIDVDKHFRVDMGKYQWKR